MLWFSSQSANRGCNLFILSEVRVIISSSSLSTSTFIPLIPLGFSLSFPLLFLLRYLNISSRLSQLCFLRLFHPSKCPSSLVLSFSLPSFFPLPQYSLPISNYLSSTFITWLTLTASLCCNFINLSIPLHCCINTTKAKAVVAGERGIHLSYFLLSSFFVC